MSIAGKQYKLTIAGKISNEQGSVGGASAQQSTGQSEDGAGAKSQNSLVKTLSKAWSSTALIRSGADATAQIVTRNMGNSVVQSKYSAISSMVSKGVNVGLAFAINPLVGFTSLLTTVTSYVVDANQRDFDRRWEREQLNATRERAGMSFNSSRTG